LSIMDQQLVELNVTGMHCNNCAMSVHKLLVKKGLQNVFVDFASEEVKFTAHGDFTLPQIIKDIEGLGYKVVEDATTHQEPFYNKVEHKFLFSLLFTIPLLLHMVLPFHFLHSAVLQLVLCTPVFALGCWHFGKSAFNSLKGGVPNMDVLIFVGSASAFVYSVIGTVQHLGENYLFYETCATIITLVLLGNVFEKRSVTQTTSAVKGLIKIQQVTANRMLNGQIEIISAKEVRPGDILVVNEGDQVPVDGDVMSGEASVNEAMLTGESIPVEKAKYDKLIGGTVIQRGNVQMMATKVGSNTVLAQIIELMKRAQSAKPPIQKLGDSIAAVFVPVVIAVALITFFAAYYGFNVSFQKALMNGIAVLVISCPCAMGLATPTAVMVGLGRAAKNGILIKGGDTIEAVANTRYVVFDKTGTLTNGKFKLQRLETHGNNTEEVKGIILGMEERSNHPIAKSLVDALQLQPVTKTIFKTVTEQKGWGMRAEDVNGNHYFLGSGPKNNYAYKTGGFNLFLYRNDQLFAELSITDDLRPEAAVLISHLKKMGLIPVLLSGDRKDKCLQIAGELGINEVHAEMLPEDKLAVIHDYKHKGKTLMVGDGINDAPALTHADVGVAMNDASQIAIQSSGVILLNADLQSVVKFLQISRHTLITIKQNLFWAFAYNIIAIPIAAFGLLNPMVGAFAMAFSDVIVIGNSLRLKVKKIS
jgi:Cu+-exporting ATPase